MSRKNYFPTALVLYFTFVIHGIGVSILAQYKEELATLWGASTLPNGTVDVSIVFTVIAALGLGRLITLPISGPVSDKFGRRTSGLIGIACYALFFIGVVFSPNMYVAYIFAIVGGAANSFIDTGVIPSLMEIYGEKGSVANMFTKFSVSIGQFVLPFMIGFVAASQMSFRTIFIVVTILLIIAGLALIFLPLPPNSSVDAAGKEEASKEKMKFTATSIAIIILAFTSTSTFQLWLNANQELGLLYGMDNPSQIQSYYAIGSIVAVLVTAVFINKKFLSPVQVLILYPAISAIMLLIIYFVQSPIILLIGGFVLGFAAAGGVLQLVTSTANEMFPKNKGKITSIVMISSSLANYIILSAAGYITKIGGVDGPKYILLFNFVITMIGVLLAIYVNYKFKKEENINMKEAQVN